MPASPRATWLEEKMLSPKNSESPVRRRLLRMRSRPDEDATQRGVSGWRRSTSTNPGVGCNSASNLSRIAGQMRADTSMPMSRPVSSETFIMMSACFIPK